MLGEFVDIDVQQIGRVFQPRMQDRVRMRRVDIVYRYVAVEDVGENEGGRAATCSSCLVMAMRGRLGRKHCETYPR